MIVTVIGLCIPSNVKVRSLVDGTAVVLGFMACTYLFRSYGRHSESLRRFAQPLDGSPR